MFTTIGSSFQQSLSAASPKYLALSSQSTGYMLIWQSSNNIYGQSYSLDNQPKGNPFQINEGSNDVPVSAHAIAATAQGDFNVIWDVRDTNSYKNTFIVIQKISADQKRLGAKVTLTDIVGESRYPVLAELSNGDKLVVWTQYTDGENGKRYCLLGKAYNASWQPKGKSFLIDQSINYYSGAPAISIIAPDKVAVVWQGKKTVNVTGIYGQLFSTQTLQKIGEVFAVGNELIPQRAAIIPPRAVMSPLQAFPGGLATTNLLHTPVVTSLPDQNFVVAWMDDKSQTIVGQVINVKDKPIGTELSTLATGAFPGMLTYPAIVKLTNGNVLVSWLYQVNTTSPSFKGQHYTAKGPAITNAPTVTNAPAFTNNRIGMETMRQLADNQPLRQLKLDQFDSGELQLVPKKITTNSAELWIGCFARENPDVQSFEVIVKKATEIGGNNSVASISVEQTFTKPASWKSCLPVVEEWQKSYMKPFYADPGWNKTWDIIVSGQFGGNRGNTDLFCYNRQAGEGVFYRTNPGRNNFIQEIHRVSGWRKTWDIIVAGQFKGEDSGYTDLLCYDRQAGEGEFYRINPQKDNFMVSVYQGKRWRKTWDIIIAGQFKGASMDFTDLFFYDRQAGEGEFYRINPQKDNFMVQVHKAAGLRKSWDMIVAGQFTELSEINIFIGKSNFTDLFFYDKQAGVGEFCRVNPQKDNYMVPIHQMTGLRKSWDMIVAGHFANGGQRTDLFFYDRQAQEVEFYRVVDPSKDYILKKLYEGPMDRNDWTLSINFSENFFDMSTSESNVITFYAKGTGRIEFFEIDTSKAGLFPYAPRFIEFPINDLSAGSLYEVTVLNGDKVISFARFDTLPKTLPVMIENDPSTQNVKPFTVFLGSCYHPAEDNGKVSNAYQKLYASRERPAIKFLVGDQVYLDLPWKDFLLVLDTEKMRDKFVDKYKVNWERLSGLLGQGGNWMLCDDHDIYNGYPEPTMANLPTLATVEYYRNEYERLAIRLFKGVQANWELDTFTIGDGELSFFAFDTRLNRLRGTPVYAKDSSLFLQLAPGNLIPGQKAFIQMNRTNFTHSDYLRQLEQWVRQLKGPGVLIISQPLFAARSVPENPNQFEQVKSETNIQNYPQYNDLVKILINSTHDIVVLSGDVHYGRVAKVQLANKTNYLYEVISSPMSLLPVELDRLLAGQDRWDLKKDKNPERFPQAFTNITPNSKIEYLAAVSPKPDNDKRAAENFTTISFRRVYEKKNSSLFFKHTEMIVKAWLPRRQPDRPEVYKDYECPFVLK